MNIYDMDAIIVDPRIMVTAHLKPEIYGLKASQCKSNHKYNNKHSSLCIRVKWTEGQLPEAWNKSYTRREN